MVTLNDDLRALRWKKPILFFLVLWVGWITEALATYPAPWPGSWVPYAYDGSGLNDSSSTGAQDPSKGNAAPGGSIEIMQGGTTTPDNASAYWYYDSSNDVVFFRLRVDQDPFKGTQELDQGIWDILLDIDGDGYKELMVELDGKGPGGTADNAAEALRVYYDNASSQVSSTTACSGGSPSAGIVYSRNPYSGGQIWQSVAVGSDFYLDFQVERSQLKNCSGTQLVTATTPIALGYATSDAQADPTQKDLTFNGTFGTTPGSTLPFGDPITWNAGSTQTPQVAYLTGSCGQSNSVKLNASIIDTLDADTTTNPDRAENTISSVQFEYRAVSGSPTGWTSITYSPPAPASATEPTLPALQPWAATWNTTGLSGVYLVRVKATDDNNNVGYSTNYGPVPGYTPPAGEVADLGYLRVDLTNGCSVTTTPVTLSHFQAIPNGGGIRFEWSTATEVGNVGFNLYPGPFTDAPLNTALIPSTVVDSTERQDYQYDLPYRTGSEFYVEDVDTRGRAKLHGPFQLGKVYGERMAADPIDWPRVRREHEAKGAERIRNWRKLAQAVGAIQLRVKADGVYRATYEQLKAAGFDLAGAMPQHLALTVGDSPVPLRVETNGGKQFGPGSYVEFVGQGLNTLYTDTNVYILKLDPSASRKAKEDSSSVKKGATVVPSYADTVIVARNRAYSYASPAGDPWYDTRLLAYAGSLVRADFTLGVDNLVQGGVGAELAVHLWGVTDWPRTPDHHVQIELNGQIVADQRFDGAVDQPIRVPLAAGAVLEGNNTVTVVLPGDAGVNYDIVSVESVSLIYPRAFKARAGQLTFAGAGEAFQVLGLPSAQVSIYRQESGALTLLTGAKIEPDGAGWRATFPGAKDKATYQVATTAAILTPEIGAPRPFTNITSTPADYLIISHPNFLGDAAASNGLNQLAAARQADGLKVALVDVEDIYAQFGGGVFDPKAIQRYIAFAAAKLGTRFVLLVGGDSYDYRNFNGLGSLSLMPSLYAQTDALIRYAPADPLYADVDGDGVPDLAIGRFPVRTDAELKVLIDKTFTYESNFTSRGKAIFAADQDSYGESDFASLSDQIAQQLPAGWQVTPAYMSRQGKDAARTALIAALNGGTALASYIGHSGPSIWSFQGLFRATDAQALTNAGKPTVVVQWGCWNTYYVSPQSNTLAHKFLLAGPQGAAAVLGATTLTYTASETELAERLIPHLTSGMTIGEAVTQAKAEAAKAMPGMADVLLGWTLLGDPALRIEP